MKYRLRRETLFMAVSLIDRYLSLRRLLSSVYELS